ncbi:DUF4430 domain-containing protein [Rubneribacter sp.]
MTNEGKNVHGEDQAEVTEATEATEAREEGAESVMPANPTQPLCTGRGADKGAKDSAKAAALPVGAAADGAQREAPAPRRRARAAAWCLAAFATFIIAVSGLALFSALSSSGGEEGADGGASVRVVADADKPSAEDTDAFRDAATEDAGITEDDPSSSADSANASNDGARAGAGDGTATEPSAESGSSATGSAAGSSTSSAAQGSSSGDSSATSDSAANTPSSPDQGAGGGSSAGSEAPAAITVRVSVDSSNAGSPVSYAGTLTFDQGATAYDALKGTGLAVASTYNVGFGSVYVQSIGGLAERAQGSSSGWKYFVNGYEPNFGSSLYTLADGDSVIWKFVLSSEEGL